MKIKSKILLPVSLAVFAVSVAILAAVILIFSDYVDTAAQNDINQSSVTAYREFEQLGVEAANSGAVMAADRDFAAAMAAKDLPAVLARAKFFDERMDIEFVTVADAEGTVLARSHEPDNFGDSVINQKNVAAALTGSAYTTIEQGTAVKLSVRCGTPVYYNGALAGVVSTGFRLDTTDFVDRAKYLTGSEITIFIGDEQLATTILDDAGQRATGIEADPTVRDMVMAGGEYSGKANVFGQEVFLSCKPIRAAEGRVIGMFYVGLSVHAKNVAIRNFVLVAGGIALLLLVLSLGVLWYLIGRIVRPIYAMVAAANALADGNTDAWLIVDTKDEIRDLADAFQRMLESTKEQALTIGTIAKGDLTPEVTPRSEHDAVGLALREMLRVNNDVFRSVNGTAAQVAAAAHQIADGAQGLAQGSSEQASVVEGLSVTMSSIAEQAGKNAKMALEAARLGKSIRGNAEAGSGQMGHLLQAVKDITEASHAIAGVIKVIDDIAFQTNILALNAAVEAARAGEHGKGFAVVAEEVRNLAAKSAEAAKDTAGLIESSIAKAEAGSHIATATAKSLIEIVNMVEGAVSALREITEAAGEQAVQIDDINKGIEQVSEVVQSNSAIAQQTAATTQELSAQANILQQMVARFRLR
ncbi:MAG: methyl-accepting chemotaxis protein [Peptococcaceae bacterium]|nr:methyl-accepting chemotaxis protein [Peptococcaceae bacterium]